MKKLAALLVLAVVAVSTVLYAAQQGEKKSASEAKDAAPAKVEAPREEPKAAAKDPEKVIVTVNGEKIKEKQISEEVDKRVEAQKKMVPAGMDVPQERWDMMRQQLRDKVAEMLVEVSLIEQQMKAKDLKVTDEQVKDRIAEVAKERNVTKEQILEQVAQYGMTEKDLENQIRTSLQVDALISSGMKDGEVTETDAKKFYDENIEQFKQPEQVQASHILIKPEAETEEAKAEAKKKAQEVLKKVKDGGDFAALAKEHSACPSSQQGGDLGMFGRGQMVPAFEEAAFGMKVGEVTDELVETQFGYHIIKVTDKQEAATQSFDEIKDRLEAYLENQKKETFWQEYKAELHENAKIEWAEGEKPAPQPMMPQMRPQ